MWYVAGDEGTINIIIQFYINIHFTSLLILISANLTDEIETKFHIGLKYVCLYIPMYTSNHNISYIIVLLLLFHILIVLLYTTSCCNPICHF